MTTGGAVSQVPDGAREALAKALPTDIDGLVLDEYMPERRWVTPETIADRLLTALSAAGYAVIWCLGRSGMTEPTDLEIVWQLADKRGEEIQRLAASLDKVLKALSDCVAKTTNYGEDEDGFMQIYIMPTGPIHRAISLLAEFGIHVRPVSGEEQR